ncbi:hypothetical protein LR48_Vigan98s000600 [Vigna angularis]|uniref:Cytochrome c oxidase subunit 3 n=1 Tax=Phaseolus angularis TaxID=3914 RepID=A0A0L9T5F5_PHAAN|nr:hypothetical protein LR48_Vigan98s000600 [Vigna angularis]
MLLTKQVTLPASRTDLSFVVGWGEREVGCGSLVALLAIFRCARNCLKVKDIIGRWPSEDSSVIGHRAAVTWAHRAILAGKEKRAVYALVATVSLALVFTGFQGMEYYQAPFTISDSIYGSTFFLATGFHGFHVIIGTLFLIICGIRQYLGHLTKEHHVGFEAAAWY